MNIQIILPTQDIENKINSVLKPVLFQGNVAEYEDVRVVVVKRSNFKVLVESDSVLIVAPIRAELFIGKKAFLSWLPGLTKTIEEIDVDIKVTFEIKPEITPQWILHPTVSGTYFWDKEPVFTIAGIPLPIKRILEIVLDSQIKNIKKTIEKFLKEEIEIKKYVKLAWEIMQKPLEVSEEYSLNLYFQPGVKPIYATPIRCSNGKIFTTVSVPLFPEGVVGFPPVHEPFHALPEFTSVNQLNAKDDIQLSGVVSYRFIENFLKNKIIEQDSIIQKVHIQDVSIYADENGLLHFSSHQDVWVKWGFLKLNIPFTGKATADIHPDDTHFIRFTPFIVELVQASPLIRLVFNLVKDNVRKIVLTQMQKMANEHWGNLQNLLKTKLSPLSIGEHVILNVEIFRFELMEIQVLEDSLKAIVHGNASAQINIGNF